MLRIRVAPGVGQAKSYFTESLDRGDYYTEGQELAGRWGGKGAERLGLSGEVRQQDFFALCENKHPQTGHPLTLRTKTNRRVGYDLNFHAPKDLSTVYALTGDAELLAGFTDAVDATMQDIETDMQCRVRKGGEQSDRTTGNLAWSLFVHQTARPVGGVPDPHMHAHAFTFNATHDNVEDAWKAGQFGNIKKDGEYYETLFHNRLRRNVEGAGYRTEAEGKFWRLRDAPRGLRDKFSRRADQVELEAQKKGIQSAERKDELAARTREAKSKGLTMSELRPEWLERLDPAERAALLTLKGERLEPKNEKVVAQRAVEFAREHAFERNAVVSEKSYLTLALRHAGPAASPEAIRAAVREQKLLRSEIDGRPMVTTKEVLAEEQGMIRFAREGRGKYDPLSRSFDASGTTLSAAQQRAAEGILASRDGVTIFRGGAGTGKTYTMKTVEAEIIKQKKTLFATATTADAAHRVLREDGFEDAVTIQRMLVDPKLQSKLKGQVLWVDEAGLMGTRTMAQVFELAKQHDTRLILSGDDKQHGAVERGGPFRLLREAGVVSVELSDIRRQQGDYREIVAKITAGKHASAFRDLDRLGWVQEVPQGSAHQAIAQEVTRARGTTKKKPPLVIAPTHREKDKLNTEIRTQLRQAGTLTGRDREFQRLVSVGLTAAERRELSHYKAGQVVCFQKRTAGYQNGDQAEVVRIDENDVWIRGLKGGTKLKRDEPDRFDLFEKKEVSVSAGDTLRITRGGRAKLGKHALRTGATYEVKTFEPDTGDIRLTNDWVIGKHFGHFDHGYVETSFASQGKTTDRVLVAQSAESFGASNAEQFYVSVSRGKTSACIYTDDKEQLEQKIQELDKMRNASDHFEQDEEPVRDEHAARLAERRAEDERKRKQAERTL
ncbi:MobF family relaxase [Botrimarina mediterranea]|uniref:MobF family relaxase n=1 Tax=Botrimarina mediterranea TaxID=2528022 RepID=UPI001189AE0B|nr:Multifunctional conjugation protein TraI [Planctomycetes bacterium K2D]